MERERKKERGTYTHMHRPDHGGPIPLKKIGKEQKKKKKN